jgi:hypothetical protein
MTLKLIVISSFLFLFSCSFKSNYTLKWRTASEVQNFGYDIYRSESPKSGFIKISLEPILGAGTSDIINEYIYIDKNLTKGKTYYYYIESISENGVRRKFTKTKEITIESE